MRCQVLYVVGIPEIEGEKHFHPTFQHHLSRFTASALLLGKEE